MKRNCDCEKYTECLKHFALKNEEFSCEKCKEYKKVALTFGNIWLKKEGDND